MRTNLENMWVCGLITTVMACSSGSKPSVNAHEGGSAGAGGVASGAGGLAGDGGQLENGGATAGPSPNAIQYDGLNGIARNPIISHVFTADPSAHVFEGRIYVYASHDLDDQDNYDMIDYHVFSSDDLVNWQDHGVALDVANIPWANTLYAPDCAYSQVTGKYYLYFPNGGANIGVAVSEHPGGPFTDALGKPLVDRSTPGVSDVDWIFDPACFVDDDGQAYLYFGGGMPKSGDNARVIRLGKDMISLADAAATTIVAPDFFEASFVHKHNGKYYFSYSTTTAEHPATIDYLMSDSPMTGFEFVGTALLNPTGNYNLNNHHSIVEFEGNTYAFYHNRVLTVREQKTEFQRSINLTQLSYNEDGTLVQPPRTTLPVTQLKNLDAYSRLEAETMADQRGVEVDFAEAAGTRTGVMVTQLQNEDWIGYSQMDFGDGAKRFRARVASGADAGGRIDVYVGGCDLFANLLGQRIGACLVEPTGGWQTWTDIECDIDVTKGVHDVYLRFSGVGTDALLNIDYFQFE